MAGGRGRGAALSPASEALCLGPAPQLRLGLVRAAREVREQGTFGYAAEALPGDEASACMLRTPR